MFWLFLLKFLSLPLTTLLLRPASQASLPSTNYYTACLHYSDFQKKERMQFQILPGKKYQRFEKLYINIFLKDGKSEICHQQPYHATNVRPLNTTFSYVHFFQFPGRLYIFVIQVFLCYFDSKTKGSLPAILIPNQIILRTV